MMSLLKFSSAAREVITIQCDELSADLLLPVDQSAVHSLYVLFALAVVVDLDKLLFQSAASDKN
jgi:hypothetical protein